MRKEIEGGGRCVVVVELVSSSLHRVKTLGEREHNWEAWSCFCIIYHSKKTRFFLTLFPFPFTCSSQLTMAIVVPLGSILFYISSFSIKFRIQKPTTPLQNQKRPCTFQSQKHESTRRPSNPRCPLLELSKPFPIAPTPTYTYTYYLARGTMLQHEEGFDTRNLLYKWCLL